MENAVAIYARYSTDRQDARSIDDQVRRCRAFAESRSFRVVAEYSDAAESGSHRERADLRKLIAAGSRGRSRAFSSVLVDDLSRLSRDLGDTWRIVFEELGSAGVRVIDCTTGMASDASGARLTFGAMALVNDAFLQLVRSETHRGLEGRALAGFWAGGRVFGYRTEIEPNPPDPEHPRKVPVIDPNEAGIVRSVFRDFADGVAPDRIAKALNERGIPAPYDRGGYSKPAGRGWAGSTIRAMLTNERYMGRFVWNKRKWVQVAGKKAKRCTARPASEWVIRDVPELAIVDRAQWDIVAEKLAARKRRHVRRVHGEGRRPHLLSGLLRCGSCGSTMTIRGARTKGDRTYFAYVCSARTTKGTCTNGQTVSEQKANTTVVQVIQEAIGSPERAREFASAFARHLKTAQSPKSGDDAKIREAEARIANLTNAVACAGWSQALADCLRKEEDQLAALRASHAAEGARSGRKARIPSATEIERYFSGMISTLAADVERGRELLRRFVGRITLTPKTEGERRYYLATLPFDFSVCLTTLCGGRI